MSQKSSNLDSARPWAKLVSLNPNHKTIEFTVNPTVLSFEDKDASHAKTPIKFHYDNSGSYRIYDGTSVDGRKLEYGEKVHNYIFCPDPQEYNQLKRSRDDVQPQEASHQKKHFTKDDDCPLCCNLIYDCVTTWPCLHHFCAACLSEKIKSFDTCPRCDGEIMMAKKNNLMNSRVQGAGVIRSQDEKERMDATNIIEGIFEWIKNPDGYVYIGNVKGGMRQGKGICRDLEETFFYEGDWINDKEDGKGKYIYTSKDKYEGEFQHGLRHGTGKYTYANGDVYEGQWIDDLGHGKGELKEHDGTVYNGDWVSGKVQGKGRMSWPNGDIYDGEWIDDKAEGCGEITWSNGSSFKGIWVKGRMEIIIKGSARRTYVARN